MAESDDKLARSYRGLAREEPPAALDAAILAAARESVRPRVRNRWAGPVSIAAVLVLGLGVSLRMQTEQPGIESSAPPPSSSSAEYPVASSADTAAPEASVKEAKPEARAKDAQSVPHARAKALAVPANEGEKNVASAPAAPPQAQGPKLSSQPAEASAPAPASRYQEKDSPPPEALAKKRSDAPAAEAARVEARPFADAPAAAPAPATAPMAPPPVATQPVAPTAPPTVAAQSIAPAAPARSATPAASPAPLRAKREAAAGAVAQDSAASKPDADERVTELERIARLRRDGKDAEADKALQEFRRRNPDYRIPEAVWERVRPR